jgi:pimeloyl-ACP methyl ester carboxylesterase
MQPNVISTNSRKVGPGAVPLEILEAGKGRPILFLHPGIGLRDATAFIQKLSVLGHVIAPAHPGFHGSANHASATSVDDLSYLYLDLLEELDEPAIVVGSSLGGWIALEAAVKCSDRIAGLVLVDTVGVRFNTRDVQDFADIYARSSAELNALLYHDAARGQIDYPSRPVAELEVIARNREAEARLAWSPYLHSPRLGTRLHRAKVPTMVVWGASDGFAPRAYGQRLAKALPNASFEVIDEAGHFPHIEQPDQLVATIRRFVESLPAAVPQRKEFSR